MPLRLLLLLCLSSLLAACASLDAWERAKVYRPTAVDAALWPALLAEQPGVTAEQIPLLDNQQVTALHFPATGAQAAHVHVLYLHGTLRHALQNSPKIAGITRNGLDVLAPDYRGWGVSSPRLPDEASLYEDAWAAWQLARATPGPWVIYGHSMGSAVAVQLAQRITSEARAQGQPAGYCALVLESAFTSFADVARSANGLLGPLAVALGNQKMATMERIAQVQGPIWMLHGTADRTVPVELGERLFAAAPAPKHWLALPLDHSNLQTDQSGRYDQAWRQIRDGCIEMK